MRVSISYSIELEELPETVADMIDEVGTSLQEDISGSLEDAKSNLSIGDAAETSRVGVALQQISRVREVLAKTDLRLQDCDHMLRGYIQTKQQLALAEAGELIAQPPAVPEEEASNEEGTE